MDINELKQAFAQTEKRFLTLWEECLHFQTIGVDPNHAADCRSCAEWLCQRMQEIGLKVNLLETVKNPVACGTFKGEEGKPHIVFYGHYDVQPVDPINEWQSDPFEPRWHDGRLYARGAQDDKGQIISFLQAVESVISMDKLKCSLTILLEGEEESGSSGLRAALPEWREWLKSDVLMAMDTSMAAFDVPAIVVGLRGLLSFELEVGGLKHDLHSGLYGGVVKNPATELARLIGTMFNPDGSVAIEGFYRGIAEPSSEVLELIAKIPFDEKDCLEETGVLPTGGEQRFPAKVRNGLRPTLDIMGIDSGYKGEGVKTIIPSIAKAKFSARLVVPQDPSDVFNCVREHVKKFAPQGLEVKVIEVEGHPPVLQDVSDSNLVQSAITALKDLFPQEPVVEWCGASIPVIADLAKITEAEPLLIGFGLAEDNIHAPNESYSLRQFKAGFMYGVQMLLKFSE